MVDISVRPQLVAWGLELGACGLDYIGEWPSARAVD